MIRWFTGCGCGLFGVALGCGPAVVTVVVFSFIVMVDYSIILVDYFIVLYILFYCVVC